MAEVKFGFDARDLFQIITELSPRSLEQIAQKVVDDIRQQAQGNSKGIDRNGKTKSLPKLSKSYKDYRAGKHHFRRYPGTSKATRIEGEDPNLIVSSLTSKNKSISNMTLTGNLMLGLTYSVDVSRGEVRVFFGGNHATAKLDGGPATRDQLYTWLLERDKNYEILNVRPKLLVQIRNIITREIARKLRKFN